MIFRTIIDIEKSGVEITPDSKLFFTGSCFTENIGNIIKNLQLETIINHSGIVYNPSSVKNSLLSAINNEKITEKDIFFYNNKWQSFNHHGKFSNTNKENCIKTINNETEKAHKLLKKADFLFITFGTSWIYRFKKDKKIVANCHKLPAKEFNREMLRVESVISDYKQLLNKIFEFNPKIKVVFTVSPVRHLKDGANGNQLSKSTLLLAVNKIVNSHKNTLYFPSYELVMDDLRDYRFYEEDMIHINNIAINYIWEKLKQGFASKLFIDYEKEIKKINSAYNHKPFNSNSSDYKKFINSTINKLENIEKKYKKDLSILKQKFLKSIQ